MKTERTFGLACALALLLPACSGKRSEESKDTSIKYQQYYLQGQQLYATHCSNCHQKDGSGLGLVYPPLNTSDYMENNFERVICLMRNGTQAEILVNGNAYVQGMPGLPTLTDLEIAEIATYIYNTWEHDQGLIEVASVADLLNSCDAQTGPNK